MLYLRNNGDQKITTNPSGWNLIADGLKYGYNSITFDSSLGFRVDWRGAEVHWNEWGNFLWKLKPSTSQAQSFSAASKDLIYPDSSIITAYALRIRIDE